MIDLNALQSIRGIADGQDTDLLKDLLEIFQVQSQVHLDAIQKGASHQDFDLIIRSAHTLRSSCYSLGCTEMAILCSRIEDLARTGNVDHELITRLLEVATSSIWALTALIEQH